MEKKKNKMENNSRRDIVEALESLGQWLGANEKIRDQFEIIILSLAEDLKKLDERAGASEVKVQELNDKVLELEMRVMTQQLANLELRASILEGRSKLMSEKWALIKQRMVERRLSKSDFSSGF
jgi:hypothetical protein